MRNQKVYCCDIEKLRLEEEEVDLKIEQPTEVVISNKYSHISAGTELACIRNLESFFDIPGVPGYTGIGEVLEVGEQVEHVKPGDVVFTMGKHQKYYKIDTTDRWGGICVKLPEGVNEEYAAFAHMGNIAFVGLRKSNIELGDDVLITGLGTIGNITAQLAQLQGANVYATDINEHRIEIAKECGVRNPVNSTRIDLKKYIDEKTNGALVSTYIDASGSARVVELSTDLVMLNGETILLGTPRAEVKTNLTSFLQRHHYLPWNHTLKGALEFTIPTFQTEFVKHSIERNVHIFLNLIKDGKINIGPLYSHKMAPSEAQVAYNGLREKPDEFIGVLFDWN